jgi:hypothetical protein
MKKLANWCEEWFNETPVFAVLSLLFCLVCGILIVAPPLYWAFGWWIDFWANLK